MSILHLSFAQAMVGLTDAASPIGPAACGIARCKRQSNQLAAVAFRKVYSPMAYLEKFTQ